MDKHGMIADGVTPDYRERPGDDPHQNEAGRLAKTAQEAATPPEPEPKKTDEQAKP